MLARFNARNVGSRRACAPPQFLLGPALPFAKRFDRATDVHVANMRTTCEISKNNCIKYVCRITLCVIFVGHFGYLRTARCLALINVLGEM